MTKKRDHEAEMDAYFEATGWRYVNARMPRKIPAGRVLVHNHVRHTESMLNGANGFRCWTMLKGKQAPDFVPCPCGWSGLPHYATAGHVKATKGKCSTAAQCGLEAGSIGIFDDA
jgi:hypothetical protein